jgi:hypothetical protein
MCTAWAGVCSSVASVACVHVVQAALKTTAALKPGSDTELNAQILEDIASDAPSMALGRDVVLQPVADVMATCGLQPTKTAAKRHVPVHRYCHAVNDNQAITNHTAVKIHASLPEYYPRVRLQAVLSSCTPFVLCALLHILLLC